MQGITAQSPVEQINIEKQKRCRKCSLVLIHYEDKSKLTCKTRKSSGAYQDLFLDQQNSKFGCYASVVLEINIFKKNASSLKRIL